MGMGGVAPQQSGAVPPQGGKSGGLPQQPNGGSGPSAKGQIAGITPLQGGYNQVPPQGGKSGGLPQQPNRGYNQVPPQGGMRDQIESEEAMMRRGTGNGFPQQPNMGYNQVPPQGGKFAGVPPGGFPQQEPDLRTDADFTGAMGYNQVPPQGNFQRTGLGQISRQGGYNQVPPQSLTGVRGLMGYNRGRR